jgi:hypothetical protein
MREGMYKLFWGEEAPKGPASPLVQALREGLGQVGLKHLAEDVAEITECQRERREEESKLTACDNESDTWIDNNTVILRKPSSDSPSIDETKITEESKDSSAFEKQTGEDNGN